MASPLLAAALPTAGVAAHRGASGTHPENTLPALREAVRLGVAMIEIDVQLTADGGLVLMHDDTVDRTTNGTGRPPEMPAAEIAALDAGAWKAPEFTGVRVPTFAEALAVLPRDRWLNVHIKGGPAVARAAALALAADERLDHAFIAGLHAECDAARAAVPGVLTCNMTRRPDPADYVRETLERGDAFIQLRGHFDDPRFGEWIAALRAGGVRINYYGTNDPAEFARLRAAGVAFPLVDEVQLIPTEARWVD
jgi:glycerophosphoryl diester phosphodiesterase